MSGGTLRVGILAGESSGDILGAGLMQALQARYPQVSFSGIGGPLMSAAGLQSMVPMERLSVMGFIEPLKRLRELLRIRRNLCRHFLKHPPDVFIGIDSPDFNLGIEERLRKAGIPTVHYVSPSVWAWRRKRIHKIGRAVDLMLTLFPFETAVYGEHGIRAVCVGHPLADQIPLQSDTAAARDALGLQMDAPVLALLPGSRGGEVARHGPVFLRTAERCRQFWPDLQLVLPCAGAERRRQIEDLLEQEAPQQKPLLLDGQSRTAMAAADAILLVSGTATLEALLLKKPMVVCYRMSWFLHLMVRLLVRVPFFALPNLLAGKQLVPELIQDEVSEENLARLLREMIETPQKQAEIQGEFTRIHQSLRLGASERAADAIRQLLKTP